MTFKETLETYKEMQPIKRMLLLMGPAAAVVLFLLATAPHTPPPAHDPATLAVIESPDCPATKLRLSVFGRSLVTYDWQSGNCSETKARKVRQ